MRNEALVKTPNDVIDALTSAAGKKSTKSSKKSIESNSQFSELFQSADSNAAKPKVSANTHMEHNRVHLEKKSAHLKSSTPTKETRPQPREERSVERNAQARNDGNNRPVAEQARDTRRTQRSSDTRSENSTEDNTASKNTSEASESPAVTANETSNTQDESANANPSTDDTLNADDTVVTTPNTDALELLQNPMLASQIAAQTNIQTAVGTNSSKFKDGDATPSTQSTVSETKLNGASQLEIAVAGAGKGDNDNSGQNPEGNSGNHNGNGQAETNPGQVIAAENRAEIVNFIQSEKLNPIDDVNLGQAIKAELVQKLDSLNSVSGVIQAFDANSTRTPATTAALTTQSPANAYAETAMQVEKSTLDALPFHVKKAVEDGQNILEIRLDPLELGKIHIRLERGADETINAHITADNPKTYELLQADSRVLERNLRSIGVNIENGSLQFSLGQNSQNPNQNNNKNEHDATPFYNADSSPVIDGLELAGTLSSSIAYNRMYSSTRVDRHV